jgi:hypothetical protein
MELRSGRQLVSPRQARDDRQATACYNRIEKAQRTAEKWYDKLADLLNRHLYKRKEDFLDTVVTRLQRHPNEFDLDDAEDLFVEYWTMEWESD